MKSCFRPPHYEHIYNHCLSEVIWPKVAIVKGESDFIWDLISSAPCWPIMYMPRVAPLLPFFRPSAWGSVLALTVHNIEQVHQFPYAQITPDTLLGFRRRGHGLFKRPERQTTPRIFSFNASCQWGSYTQVIISCACNFHHRHRA